MLLKNSLIFGFILIIGLHVCTSCELDQTRQGCRIENGLCVCGLGCISDYRYKNRLECQTALKGRRKNVCFQNPCMNGGSCIQISQEPGFRCRCEGTGFYGDRCNRPCPGPRAIPVGGQFPYECIVI